MTSFLPSGDPTLFSTTSPLPLPLDSSISLWVLLPISIALLISGLLSHYSNQANESHSSSSTSLLKHQSTLNYSSTFRKTFLLLPHAGFELLKHRLTNSVDFGLHEHAWKSRLENFENEDESHIDPNAVISSMFQQVFQILPNMVQFAWVSHLFSGFIVAKLPFFIPPNFKTMLHHSIPSSISWSSGLDTSYVSSISWYIITILGVKGIHNLIVANDDFHTQFDSSLDNLAFNHRQQLALGDSLSSQDQFQALNPFIGGGPDFQKDLHAERDEVKLLFHQKSTLTYSQEQLLLSFRNSSQLSKV